MTNINGKRHFEQEMQTEECLLKRAKNMIEKNVVVSIKKEKIESTAVADGDLSATIQNNSIPSNSKRIILENSLPQIAIKKKINDTGNEAHTEVFSN